MRSPLTKELLAIRSAWQGVGVKHEETPLTVLASHGDALHRIANVYAGGDGEDEDLYQEILMPGSSRCDWTNNRRANPYSSFMGARRRNSAA